MKIWGCRSDVANYQPPTPVANHYGQTIKTTTDMEDIAKILLKWIERHEKLKSETPFMMQNGVKYSLRDLHTHITNGTELGKETVESIVSLAISMLQKDIDKLSKNTMQAFVVTFDLEDTIEYFSTREKAVTWLNSGGYHFVKNRVAQIELDNEKRYYKGKDRGSNDFAQIKEITIN